MAVCWRRILCRIFFHKLVVVHQCTKEIRKVACLRCGRRFGMHDGVRAFLPWTPDLNITDCEHD